MSEGRILSRPAEFDGSFLSGVLACYDEFLEAGDPATISFKITLWDGSILFFKKLRVNFLANVPGCVMLRGENDPEAALVIREDQIISVDILKRPLPPALSVGFP